MGHSAPCIQQTLGRPLQRWADSPEIWLGGAKPLLAEVRTVTVGEPLLARERGVRWRDRAGEHDGDHDGERGPGHGTGSGSRYP